MSTIELIELIEKLPVDQQNEVKAFVLAINEKKSSDYTSNGKPALLAEPAGSNGRGYGSLKGLITYISDDFDEPLEDFKDYM